MVLQLSSFIKTSQRARSIQGAKATWSPKCKAGCVSDKIAYDIKYYIYKDKSICLHY